MVQNNKVLTVSYGTFSCTLEGFEDSFGTMKVIAEYFRDLAADDRYFGAEPPQPDAEVLARIAQKEIARQVEARADREGVHLRAAAAALPPAAPAEAAPAAEEPPVKAAPEAVETPEPPAVTEDAAPEPVAEETPAEPEAPEKPAAAPVVVDAEEVEAEAEDALIEETAEPAPQGVVPAADSIAAKLQRIRDVVARGTAGADDEYTEDEHADAFLEDAAEDISQALGETAEDAPEAEAAADAAADSETEDDIAWTLDHLDLTGSATAPDDGGDEDTSEAETEDAASAEDSLFGGLEAQDEEDSAAGEDSNILTAEEPAPAVRPARPAKARIIRVKRAQLDEAIAAGDLEPIEDEAGSAETAEQAASEETLSAEDEADMLRELAAVEAELRGSGGEDAGSIDEDWDEEADSGEDHYEEAAAPLTAAPQEAQESDISRLMAAADEKLGTAESESSRETYSRLRAAVAAAEAEREAGGSSGTGDDADAYRDDLASVVRPRRPAAPASASPRRPEPASRPAPLKLVAEQMVDSPEAEAAASGPVRPRRIASFRAEESEVQDAGAEGGFAAYAEESGAAELHELLEAAASYLSFVEGRDQFSRPQLMHKVQQLGHAEFNREDGLRSFGQLLREGKIERTNSGRFTASGDIGFRPGERAAG